MAGAGYKAWSAGDVLAAADVNTYLMEQSVMVFAGSAVRATAITSATEGMLSFLTDTDSLEYFDGSNWNGVSNPGDITAVTAGTALTGGGSSGDVTLNFDFTTAAPLTSSTATTYTVTSADAGSYLQFSNAATITVGTTTAFTAGQQVQILADGTALTISGDGGVTLAGAGTAGTAVSFTVGNQYEAVAIVGVGSNAYRIIGNVTGA